MDDVLQSLTDLGQQGYAVSLVYGMTCNSQGHPMIGWSCVIGARTIGSVTIGMFEPTGIGYSPTDPIEAARIALEHMRRKDIR